jgi:hypothetical protein
MDSNGHYPIPPPPPPPPLPNDRNTIRASSSTLTAEGGTIGSDRGGLDSTFTLSATADAASTASGAFTASPNVTTAGDETGNSIPPRIATDESARRSARDARAVAAKAQRKAKADEKKAAKRARRKARLAVLEDPPKVAREWGFWIAGGVLVAGVAAFGWRISEKTDPQVLVQNVVPAGAQQTQTSGPAPLADPFAGFGKPVHSMAAGQIGSWDPNGQTVAVATTVGELELGADRATNIANQVRGQVGADLCKVALFAMDPRQTPTVVAPDASGKTPLGAVPVFDCSPPASTVTSVAGS